LGALGFVNAAFELKRQIEAGDCPEPDFIYVAAGTTGTAAGLILGAKAAGLKTKVILVRVTAESFVNVPKVLSIMKEANGLLRKGEPSFPRLDLGEEDVAIRNEFLGECYALYTPESVDAVAFMHRLEHIKIEGTYTGKAFAAFLHDARTGPFQGKTAMFWNTYNSADFSDRIREIDYHRLPKAFHVYFETDVQPLDRELRALAK